MNNLTSSIVAAQRQFSLLYVVIKTLKLHHNVPFYDNFCRSFV